MSKINKPELLSPCGSMESLMAAVANGCNAVYLGGKSFSARSYASNFSKEELEQACDYCHLRGVKVYVTVNTLYKDSELPLFIEYIGELYTIGVDALIVQDIGAASIIKKSFPDFKLNASTQLTANNIEDVNFLMNNGFSKVILSRELSLDEVKKIKTETSAEIECFIHGALCVSYSGQCIMSSILGGRSGNRGKCAQTCRLPYSLYRERDKVCDGYLLSPKDIQTLNILPQIIEAGVDSLKIEGRMKNPEYVAGVTAIYRKYIDMYFEDKENYKVDKADEKVLLQLFNRGGFTDGYFTAHSGLDMMSVERPKAWGLKTGIVDTYDAKHNRVSIRTREPLVPGDGIEFWTKEEPHTGTNVSKPSRAGEVINISVKSPVEKNNVVYKTFDKALMDRMKKSYEKDIRKVTVNGKAKAFVGEELEFNVWIENGTSINVKGDIVLKAENRPLAKEKIEEQLKKTGSTPFEFDKLEVSCGDDIYVGIKGLNELRRAATDALSEAILKSSKRPEVTFIPTPEVSISGNKKDKKLNIYVRNREQLDAAIECEGVNIVYYEFCEDFEENYNEIIKQCHENDIKLYGAFPRVYRENTKELYGDFVKALGESDVDGFLVTESGQFDTVKAMGKKVVTDYNMNVMNNESVEFWKEKGAEIVTMSVEMNVEELKTAADNSCEMVAYGYLPLMTTHQCPIGNFVGGKTNGMYCKERYSDEQYALKDRKDVAFPIMTDCRQCVATILNSKPMFTLKFFDEILDTPTGYIRLLFTTENAFTVKEVTRAYADMLNDCKNPTGTVKNLLEKMAKKGNTKGHYFRGVE